MRDDRMSYLALVGALALSLSSCTFTTAAGDTRTSSSSSTTSPATTAPATTQLYLQMRRSVATAKNVHIHGDYTDDGQKLQLDVTGDLAGTNMRLLVNFGNGPIEIVMVDGSFYLKADAAFWTRINGSIAVARKAAGKYVKVQAGSAAGMGDFRVGALLEQVLASDIPTAGELSSLVRSTDIDGVRAYLMTSNVGDSRIYVSADGQARLLRTESTRSGTLDFTDWDAVRPIIAPAAGEQAEAPAP